MQRNKMNLEIIFLGLFFVGTSAQDCTVQPSPSNLGCNPYARQELFLKCRINFHSDFGQNQCVSVEWHHTPFTYEDPNNETKMTNSSLIDHDFIYNSNDTLANYTNATIVESSLNCTNATVVESSFKVNLSKSYVGAFWCSVNLSYPIYNANYTIILKSAAKYSNLESCAPDEPQLTQEVKCDLPMSRTATTVSEETTTMLSTSLHPPIATSQQRTNSLSSTITESPSDDDNTEDNDENNMDDNDDSTQGRKQLTQFYIALGVVGVFGSVIATLTLVVVYTCMKYRKMMKDQRNLMRSQDSIRAPSTIPADYLVPMASQSSSQTSLTNTGSINAADSSTGFTNNPTYISTDALIQQLTMSYSTRNATTAKQNQPQHVPELHHRQLGAMEQETQYFTQNQFPQHPVLDQQSMLLECPLYPTQFQFARQLTQHQFPKDQQYQGGYEMQIPPLHYSNQKHICVPLPEGAQRKSDLFVHSYESIKSVHDYEDLLERGDYENTLTMIKNNAYTSSNTYTNSIGTD